MAEYAQIPFSERPTCTVQEACVASGLGRSTIWELMAEGRLRYTHLGRRRLVSVPSLLKLLKPSDRAVRS
jgi:excisionase family DNA binding protein